MPEQLIYIIAPTIAKRDKRPAKAFYVDLITCFHFDSLHSLHALLEM